MNNSESRSGEEQAVAEQEQEELLLRLLREEGLLDSAPRILRIARQGDLLASFAQQRMWLLDQWHPGNPAYNVVLPLYFPGDLEYELLERCLDELVARHESLRTTFRMQEGQVVQVIADRACCPLTVEDLSLVPPDQQEAALRRVEREESLVAFDLSRGPLLRARLLRLSLQKHHLLLNLHHITADGWSLSLLIQELAALYTAFAQGRSSPLPALPIQYVDFAHWQRQWLQGAVLQEQVAYWREQLAGLTPLDLPTDHPRPALQTFAGASEPFALSPALTRNLKALCQREQVTLFTLLLASFQVVLARYSGQQDIAVGTPIANRTSHEIEQVVGCFVNTLVLRTDLSGNPIFLQLLQRVREVIRQAYAHQDLPFEKLVEELHPQRDPSRPPFFQVMMIQDGIAPPIRLLDKLTLIPGGTARYTAKFDLTLIMLGDDRGLRAILEYNTDLFEASTIQRILAHWQTLLQGVATDPQRRLSALPLLSEAERDQVLREWNATQVSVPAQGVHQLFEAQVQRTPEQVALLCQGQRVTYRQLNQRANQLAHLLCRLGIGPEWLVGLYLERSLDMLVALLATLKAGGAYVPLDPIYPPQRLAYMLSDAQVSVLLTQQSLLAQLPASPGQVLCLDGPFVPWETLPDQAPDVEVLPEHPAYVIYTSGSTGQPKGVQVPHRALTNFLCSMQRQPGITGQDRLLAVTTLSFDIAGLELYGPLISGAQLILLPQTIASDGEQLARHMYENQVTLMQATPATWHLLLEAGWRGSPDLKVLCGGEAFPRPLAQRLLTHVGEVWNMYGPTETTIWSTVQQLQAADQVISIGRPIANTQAYVLDKALQPVPIGVSGELYLGGAGLARGYLHRPELTAERFVPDPFGSQAGGRLYRTGDLARWLPDGRLECLGRSDSQVKLRGYRIELGEIEAALQRHPAIRESAVVLQEETTRHPRLVAYLILERSRHPNGVPAGQLEHTDRGHTVGVLATSGVLSSQELRASLQQSLPEYMIPATFVVLEQMPLTPNGKLDRRALLTLEAPGLAHGSSYVAPRNEIEKELAEIWKQILKRPQMSIYDSFFDLGGDSLLGVRMTALARARGLQCTSQQLYQQPTIAELALAVGAASPLLAEQGDVVGILPLTPLQTWYLAQPWHNPHRWTMASLMQVTRPVAYNRLRQALQYLFRHHDGLRIRFVEEQSQRYACIDPPGEDVPLDLIDLSGCGEQKQQAIIEAQARHFREGLHLFTGPLLRIVYFDRGLQQLPQMLLVVHHIIFDAYSQMIFLHDLQVVYQQLERGEPARLPAKTTSLKQWGERLAAYVASAALRHEFETYWRLLPWERIRPLPVDFPERREQDTRGAAGQVTTTLSQEETTALLGRVTGETTILDVLLTALMRSFVPWIGNHPLYLDIVEMGREPWLDGVDLSNTIGQMAIGRWLLLSLEEGDSVEESLQSIKTQIRTAPRRGIGQYLLTFLSKDPQIREAIEALPLPEVLFNYMGQFDTGSSTATESTPLSIQHIQAELGPHWDPREKRDRLLHFALGIMDGQFWLFCEYGQDVYQKTTIVAFVDRYMETLRALLR